MKCLDADVNPFRLLFKYKVICEVEATWEGIGACIHEHVYSLFFCDACKELYDHQQGMFCEHCLRRGFEEQPIVVKYVPLTQLSEAADHSRHRPAQ